MRIAVLADIHGNMLALEAVLADIAARGADLIVDLGDRVSGPLWPGETCRKLEALGVPGVRGNHDRVAGEGKREGMPASDAFAYDALDARERAALAALPFRRDFAPGVTAFHATPAHDDRYVIDDIHEGRLIRAPMEKILRRLGAVEARVVMLGHSHRADMIRLPNGTLILNPGSVGGPGYEDVTGQRHVSEAGTPHARYAILDLGDGALPAVDFHAVSYDFERAAARARDNGRDDWAHALATGFMPGSPAAVSNLSPA